MHFFINGIFYVLENVCNLYNYADDNTLLNTRHPITCLKIKLGDQHRSRNALV